METAAISTQSWLDTQNAASKSNLAYQTARDNLLLLGLNEESIAAVDKEAGEQKATNDAAIAGRWRHQRGGQPGWRSVRRQAPSPRDRGQRSRHRETNVGQLIAWQGRETLPNSASSAGSAHPSAVGPDPPNGIVPFFVGWVSKAQPTGRKALPCGGLHSLTHPTQRRTPHFGTIPAEPKRSTGKLPQQKTFSALRIDPASGSARWGRGPGTSRGPRPGARHVGPPLPDRDGVLFQEHADQVAALGRPGRR